FQVQLGEVIVGIGQLLDHGFARFGGTIDQLGGDLFDVVIVADGNVATPCEGLHTHQIDDTLEVGLGADGKLDHQWVGAQTLAYRGDCKVEIGAGAVQLVDET